VIGVATELGQVFTNLVVNALDALAERRKRGKLVIRSGLEGKQVVVEVEDDGGGIEEHVLHRIFDPFFTTKQVGKGTGLGLSVSQQIAVNFGGRIEAASRPGEGSTFGVVRPATGAT
jgi:C4-dicarboxylate-specific signal transduction histidine kinase